MSVINILIDYRVGLETGLLVTLKLCLIIWVTGIICGSIVGIAGAKWPIKIGWPSRIVSFLISGVPVLVFLFWLHYPLQAMLDINIDPFITSFITLSIINIFLVGDLVRTVISDFPKQYLVAARVCGLSNQDIVLKIQFPIVLRQILPSLLSIQVNMLQLTLFASLIGVPEIFRVTQGINAMIYRPIEIYTSLAVFFLMICLPLNGLAIWLRYRFTRDLSDR